MPISNQTFETLFSFRIGTVHPGFVPSAYPQKLGEANPSSQNPSVCFFIRKVPPSLSATANFLGNLVLNVT